MSTDTRIVRLLRDEHPDTNVHYSFFNRTTGMNLSKGTPSGRSVLEEHDAAIAEARIEGARVILQQMEDVLYMVEAAGGLDLLEKGESAEYVKGFKEGMMTQLSSAKTALDGGLIDFNQEIRS